MFNTFETNKTKVMNLYDYIPNKNEKFVLLNSIRFSAPIKQQHSECIFSEFKIISGQVKHHKPCSQKKVR